jgi:hypothetical protein
VRVCVCNGAVRSHLAQRQSDKRKGDDFADQR